MIIDIANEKPATAMIRDGLVFVLAMRPLSRKDSNCDLLHDDGVRVNAR